MLLIYWYMKCCDWLRCAEICAARPRGRNVGFVGHGPGMLTIHPAEPVVSVPIMNEQLFQTHSDTWDSLHCLIFFALGILEPSTWQEAQMRFRLPWLFATVMSSVAWVCFPGWMSTSCSGRGLRLCLARQGESADFALRWFCTTFCRCICHFDSFIGPGMCLCHFKCQELTIFFWSSA